MARTTVRLRHVAEVSFGRSELTNFMALPARVRNALKGNDAVCLVSKTGDQVCFVYGSGKVDGLVVLMSSRLRLTGRQRWNPLMLENYAELVDLELDGIKRFETHYKKLRQ